MDKLNVANFALSLNLKSSKFEGFMFCCLSTVIYALLYLLIFQFQHIQHNPNFAWTFVLHYLNYSHYSVIIKHPFLHMFLIMLNKTLPSPTSSICIGCLSLNYTVSEGWVRPELHLPQTGDRVLSAVFRKLSRWSMLMI